MHKLELLLRKYANNFLLLDDIANNKKNKYLNFRNIVTVTDTNIVKVATINKKTHTHTHLLLMGPPYLNIFYHKSLLHRKLSK